MKGTCDIWLKAKVAAVFQGEERARERREKWEIFFWSQKSFTMTVSQIHLNFYLLSTSVNLACGWLCSCLWWFTNASLSRKVHGKISHPDHFKNKNSLQNVDKFLPLIPEKSSMIGVNDWRSYHLIPKFIRIQKYSRQKNVSLLSVQATLDFKPHWFPLQVTKARLSFFRCFFEKFYGKQGATRPTEVQCHIKMHGEKTIQ